MSELRRDPFTGQWVILAKERRNRPNALRHYPLEIEETEPCPFCPGRENLTPPSVLTLKAAQDNGAPWGVRVVPNRYPALRWERTREVCNEGLYQGRSGEGSHEVVIETPLHSTDLPLLSDLEFGNVIEAYQLRCEALLQKDGTRCIQIFKNHGFAAGATLRHPHSQILVLPVIPPRMEEELAQFSTYARRGKCLLEEIVRQERQNGSRVVAENGAFIAVAPYASRVPFEIQVLPIAHGSNFETLSTSDRQALAQILRDVLARIHVVLDKPSYSYTLATLPLEWARAKHYHWRIAVIPRLTALAGFEWGSGCYINVVAPEEAAALLRARQPIADLTTGGR